MSKDNLIINGVEYTPVKKAEAPEPKYSSVYWLNWCDHHTIAADDIQVTPYKLTGRDIKSVRFEECPEGSVVIEYRDLLYAWDYSADKIGDAPNFLKMCKLLKLSK